MTDLTNMRGKSTLPTLLALLTLMLSASVIAAVPLATIDGPIAAEAPGHPSRDAIYSASALDLSAHGYVEEEFFISGTGNQYSQPDMATGEVQSTGHPYMTRLVVRRPPEAAFNGIVIVEWINVTGGPDKDIDWWQSGEHFMRNGYAYVVVSVSNYEEFKNHLYDISYFNTKSYVDKNTTAHIFIFGTANFC